MTSLDYGLTRMHVEERQRVAEQRRMVRQARLEARAQRPQRPGRLHGIGAALGRVGHLAPWKRAPAHKAREHALTGA
jgi:hypothetical protein